MTRAQSLSFVVVVTAVLALAAPARAQWNAQSLFTEDGVEIGVDARVFTLFAMLNALGYDADDRTGPAPLHKPQYSAARQKLRQNLGRRGSAVKSLEDVIAKNPKSIAEYTAAALELGAAPELSGKGASPLAQAIAGPMAEWFNDEGGAQLLRIVAEEVKPTQKRLLPAADKAIKAATKLIRLGDAQDQLLDDSGPQGRVVVLVNELDRHGTLQVVRRGEVTYVVTGALEASGDELVVDAATLAYARTLVARDTQKVEGGTLAEVRTRLDAAGQSALPDDKAAAAELLACAFTRKVRGDKATCFSSPLLKQPAAEEALVAMAPRVDAYASTTAPLAVALADLLAPLPPPPPPADAVPVDPKGKGKGKGK